MLMPSLVKNSNASCDIDRNSIICSTQLLIPASPRSRRLQKSGPNIRSTVPEFVIHVSLRTTVSNRIESVVLTARLLRREQGLLTSEHHHAHNCGYNQLCHRTKQLRSLVVCHRHFQHSALAQTHPELRNRRKTVYRGKHAAARFRRGEMKGDLPPLRRDVPRVRPENKKLGKNRLQDLQMTVSSQSTLGIDSNLGSGHELANTLIHGRTNRRCKIERSFAGGHRQADRSIRVPLQQLDR